MLHTIDDRKIFLPFLRISLYGQQYSEAIQSDTDFQKKSLDFS